MGQEPRIHYGTRFNRGLKLGFLLSLIIFFLTFTLVQKTDCGACKFDYKGHFWNYKQFMNEYTEVCLKEPETVNKTPLYVNLDKINQTKEGYDIDLKDVVYGVG